MAQAERARGAARAAGPSRPANGHGAETMSWARAHVPARRRGETTLGRRYGGPPWEKEPATEVRRWFPAGGTVLDGQGGGITRARVGGYGGGVNLAGGCLGWPVHGGWRALAAVKSTARPLGVIGDEQVCARLVTERRTLRARAI